MRGFASSVRFLFLVTLIVFASGADAQEIIQIRSGQVGGSPGACPSPDDCFHYVASPSCQMPLSSVPFGAAVFSAAATGPSAQVVGLYTGFWLPSLSSDPSARWINWQAEPGCLGGTARSVLYACKFRVTTPCSPMASISACWAVDDFLGDPGSGANPIGVYINGVPLNSGFSGGNYATETCASQTNVPLVTGDNYIYIYQRDAGCSVSGVMFSATLTVTPAMASSITAMKFNDLNGNGVQDGGEPGLPGWQINLSGPVNQSGTTGVGGQVTFFNLPPGSYQITETPQPGWIQTYPAGGINYLTINCLQDFVCYFGNRRCAQSSCITLPSCITAWFPFDECAGTTANEVVANRDGTLVGGTSNPTWGTGSYGTPCAVRFPGSPGTQAVVCPDYPEHDFGTGSFSVFAWVKTTNTDGQIHTIVDKRDTPFATPTGYALYLFGGIFRFQFDDGSGAPTTYVSTAPPVNDGAWHTVSVSVCRYPNNPAANVAKLVVDHHVDTFTGASIKTGSLSNNAGLHIGDQCPGFITGIPFDGSIDEVQLYKCCLSETQLFALYNDFGYCKESCYLPSMRNSFFPWVNTSVTVCNYSLSSQTYTWTIAPLPAGPGCSVNGPTVFSPYSGTVTVPAATSGPACVNIPITMFFPAGMTWWQTACYQVTIQNLATGNCFGCRGRIRKMHWFDAWPNPTDILAAPNTPVAAHFKIHNSADTPLLLDYTLTGQSSDGDPDNNVVSLNGLPPGIPVTGTLTVAAHDSSTVDITAVLTDFQPLNPNEIVLEADVDGDGVLDPLASLALISVTADASSEVPRQPEVGPVNLGTTLEASPNPFREQTGIQLTIGSPLAGVRVEVYDVGGRLVRVLLSGNLDAGRHLFVWDGSDDRGSRSSAGLYFIRARAQGMSIMTKVIRLE